MNEYKFKAQRIEPIYFEPTEVIIRHYPGTTTQEIDGVPTECAYVQAESIERFSTGERIERLNLFIPITVLSQMEFTYDPVSQERKLLMTPALESLFATKNMQLLPDEIPVPDETPEP